MLIYSNLAGRAIADSDRPPGCSCGVGLYDASTRLLVRHTFGGLTSGTLSCGHTQRCSFPNRYWGRPGAWSRCSGVGAAKVYLSGDHAVAAIGELMILRALSVRQPWA